MYRAMKRLEVQTLRLGGLTVPEVADKAGVSLRTVNRILQEEAVRDPAETDAVRQGRMGRPSAVEPFRERLQQWLQAEPTVRTAVLLGRLRQEGYGGGKTAAYRLVQELRPARVLPGVVRFEAVAGEFSQHDFGTVTVEYTDGAREAVHFFASRLKYSRLIRVQLVPDERTETVCHGLVDAFGYFGGLPLLAVFDNPKTIVQTRRGAEVVWQEPFRRFCGEIGCVPSATWPRHPQEKGAVENLVGFVKGSFFKAERFRDRPELAERLEAWHRLVNDERPCRATGEVPRVRHLLELPRLRPLTLGPNGFTLKYARWVRTDGYCEFEGRRYFASLANAGQMATLHVGRNQVEIWLDLRQVAVHPREPVNGKYSLLPEQRGEVLRKRGARSYVKRQLLLDLCPAAEWWLTELRHRRPEWWRAEVDRLFELLEQVGEERMQQAFGAAAQAGTVGAEYLEAVLLGHTGSEVGA
jgi:transposase